MQSESKIMFTALVWFQVFRLSKIALGKCTYGMEFVKATAGKISFYAKTEIKNSRNLEIWRSRCSV